MTDPAAPAPQRLTLAQQALVNLLAAIALDIHADDGRAARIDALTQLLPVARHKAPAALFWLIDVADEMLIAWPAVVARKEKAGTAWAAVMTGARTALIAFFDARALAAWNAHRDSTEGAPHAAA